MYLFLRSQTIWRERTAWLCVWLRYCKLLANTSPKARDQQICLDCMNQWVHVSAFNKTATLTWCLEGLSSGLSGHLTTFNINFYLYNVFYHVCLYVAMSHERSSLQQRLEEGVGSPGVGVTSGCESPQVAAGSRTLQEQCMLWRRSCLLSPILLFSVSEWKVTQCPGSWQRADLMQQDYRVNVLWKLLSQDFCSLSFCMWEREQVYLRAHVCRGQRSSSSVFSKEPSTWTFETKSLSLSLELAT